MAVVSGSLLFDRRRLDNPAGLAGIADVPIVLFNIVTEAAQVSITDSNGNFSFTGVENGDYRVVEAFGYTGGIPEAKVPPLSFVTNPPAEATNLDCVTPNTLLITVDNADITGLNILNGPVTYTSIDALLDGCAEIIPGNLITAADDGTFGFFPAGTPANTAPTIPPVVPYPGLVPDFEYVLSSPTASIPDDGQYTIQNIMNNNFNNSAYAVEGTWWRIADHTTGNETGRFMLVNGFRISSVFFDTVVTVKPDTHYLFTSWIINVYKVPGFLPPALGVRITGNNTGILYEASLGMEIPTEQTVPHWLEIGTDIFTGNNTNIRIEFVSEGEAGFGNDYAVDDVSLSEVIIPEFIPVKSADKSAAEVGEIITYTITLENTCTHDLTSVFFQDTLQAGLAFVLDSLIVNGTPFTGVDIEQGVRIADVPGEGMVTITFEALVTEIPAVNPIPNTANMTYEYTPVLGGIPSEFNEESNTVFVTIISSPQESADVSVMKTAFPKTVNPGDELTYTIIIENFGPSLAENVVLTDIIPAGILNPEYSLDGSMFLPWTGSFSLGSMEPNTEHEVIIKGIVADDAPSRIVNTATVESVTPDPNLNNNTSTVTVQVFREPSDRCKAITDVVQSAALQEAAISHILNAEGEKIQEIVAMYESGDATAEQVAAVNNSAVDLVNALNMLESAIQSKLRLLADGFKECGEE
jgi:uncharacterized repeat protein (TIGR01451 family)